VDFLDLEAKAELVAVYLVPLPSAAVKPQRHHAVSDQQTVPRDNAFQLQLVKEQALQRRLSKSINVPNILM
jgi:hypothetical protein